MSDFRRTLKTISDTISELETEIVAQALERVQNSIMDGIDADDVLEQRDVREIRQEEREETLEMLVGGTGSRMAAPTIEAEDLADMDALLGLEAMSVSAPVPAPAPMRVPVPVPVLVPAALPTHPVAAAMAAVPTAVPE